MTNNLGYSTNIEVDSRRIGIALAITLVAGDIDACLLYLFEIALILSVVNIPSNWIH